MENESFENETIAKILNDNFISIKVDKEERPDIDTVYMRVCLSITGSGGWPTSIFMSPEQKPFYAGTYFPPKRFSDILNIIKDKWRSDRKTLYANSDVIIEHINKNNIKTSYKDKDLALSAYEIFTRAFDKEYGGFGNAPKFPSPHNLLFLIGYAQYSKEGNALDMVEKTLLSMYKGGIFDHIGYGFSRYSTDKYWLAPHFEKMLYDNALLAVSYLYAYEQTGNDFYKSVAEKIFIYTEREMANKQGGFYSAQDADSDGEEGKYYVFTPEETINVLGKTDGEKFNNYYDITRKGNFEGKNIPNLINQTPPFKDLSEFFPKLYEYRKNRTNLHKDNKCLTSWNALMIWAYAEAYRILGDVKYLMTAEKSIDFIENNLADKDTLFVGITNEKKSNKGFIDDYAFYILALTAMYGASFNEKYLNRALELNNKVIRDFYDSKGGFYFYENTTEQLIIRPKECYDGAIPSGNSVMAFNLDRLAKLTKDEKLYALAQNQREFMDKEANEYPSGFCFYLLSTLPTKDIICVLKEKDDVRKIKIKSDWVVRVLETETKEYPLVNNQTTFYICLGNQCLPPVNTIDADEI